MRISDWSSDVCSSDLLRRAAQINGDHVHRDPPRQRNALTGHDQGRAVGERAMDAVGIADRDHADRHPLRTHEVAAVANAFARSKFAYRDPAAVERPYWPQAAAEIGRAPV